MSQRFCVFCGGPPAQKTVEHVIPRWLIELTGDPKREGNFGPLYDRKTQNFRLARFPYENFHFPACKACNNHFSVLEGEAKRVLLSILGDSYISAQDLNIFLTWLDKIRIGVWLGIYYLHKPVADIEPHMFISSRFDKADRLVFIYRAEPTHRRLNFAGIGSPLYEYLPTCFTLFVNNYAFFNISTDFLFASRIGLPYPQSSNWIEWPYIYFDMLPGRERINLPLLRKPFNTKCFQVYQPMYGREEIREGFADLYDTRYVNEVSAVPELGIGRIFFCEDRKLEEFPLVPSMAWLPKTTWYMPSLYKFLSKQTLEMQLYLLKFMPDHRGLDVDRQKIVKSQIQLSREFNRMLLKKLDRYL
jgi:hypothetical protein